MGTEPIGTETASAEQPASHQSGGEAKLPRSRHFGNLPDRRGAYLKRRFACSTTRGHGKAPYLPLIAMGCWPSNRIGGPQLRRRRGLTQAQVADWLQT